MPITSRGRAAVACCAFACVFTGFSLRLINLQVAKHEEYAALAADNHGLKKTIHARRGSILDVHGLPLAQNEPVKTVIADGSLIKDHGAIAQIISRALEMDKDAVL